ncbi:MAG TPA: PaaI family thioesterase [Bryobacteraceae bacterium]|nr:PaaI family thioesterase [Bryobacteraceae bacterium]
MDHPKSTKNNRRHKPTAGASARDFLTWHAFNHLLGLELVRVHRDGLTIQCRVRPELLNGAGVLHGGVTASLADAAVGSALQHHFRGKRRFTTIELKINYFRPVAEGRLRARSRLVRIGSKICVGQVDLSDEHRRSVGLAIVTYMLLDTPPAAS